MAEARGQGAPDGRYFARALAIAAADGSAGARLDRLLALVARTAGAGCAVALVRRGRRQVVIWRTADGEAGRSTGAWLLASFAAPHPRLEPEVSFVRVDGIEDGAAGGRGAGRDAGDPGTAGEAGGRGAGQTGSRDIGETSDGDGGETLQEPEGAMARRRAIGPLGRPATALGFLFTSPRTARALDRRLPPSLARPTAGLVAAFLRDLEAEQELRRLRQADADRQRFVSVVAHELRTPLASLSGYLDLLSDDPGGEFLARSRDLTEGMSTLVADLLELSRLGAGQLHLEPAPFSAAEAAQSAIRDVTPLAMQRGIALDAALAPRLRTVHADRRRVEQVLVNLLANAIKFSQAGSRVAVSLRFDGPVALYGIRDEGPGIAPGERDRIFEPFHRAAGTERIVGTGLGLPIARDLARRMGGEVDVASVPGDGSTFLVALPATDAIEREEVLATLQRALGDEPGHEPRA